jgi:hypothetical protein
LFSISAVPLMTRKPFAGGSMFIWLNEWDAESVYVPPMPPEA